MKLLHVVAARPNFPKLAPVYRAGQAAGLDQVIIHTGQHYDDSMSASFFRELQIPRPHVDLEVGSASHAIQTARAMERLEPVLLRERPDWVVVYGDVNSTLAAALVAAKLNLNLAHVEAGLRSGDRTMPEEVNRIVTDRLSSLLFAPSRRAVELLKAEGEAHEKIVFVGNVMIDSLMHMLPLARQSGARSRFDIDCRTVVVTLHRPANVDDPARLGAIADALREIADEFPVIFPIHPRTAKRLGEYGLDLGRVRLIAPMSYQEIVDVIDAAQVVVTDSGGIQEETTALGVPCLTLRPVTEWPETVESGTNRLVPDPSCLPDAVRGATKTRERCMPEGWDGQAGARIVRSLLASPVRN